MIYFKDRIILDLLRFRNSNRLLRKLSVDLSCVQNRGAGPECTCVYEDLHVASTKQIESTVELLNRCISSVCESLYITSRSLYFLAIFAGFISCTFFVMDSFAASDQDPAKQALEQLRMLQKNLSAKSDGKDKLIVKKSLDNSAQSGAQNESALARRKRLTEQSAAQTPSLQANVIMSEQEEEKVVDDMAYHNTEKQLFPLGPEKIIKLRKKYEQSELAKTQSGDTPPKPTATSQFVNLSPGSTPPVIRLSQGFVSSLVFLDSTGAPWPIAAYDLGNPGAFNIQWDKVSNTMMIQSNKLYTYGNLAVRLQGLNTPVMLTLIPGQKAVDYRVDLRIQGIGPNAENAPVEEGLPPSASEVLLHVLDGVPPPGSKRLVVSGGDARAWLFNGQMYVRTNLTILSPGWLGSMTSADGMHAYEMPKSPVILVSWHGKVMQLKVEGL